MDLIELDNRVKVIEKEIYSGFLSDDFLNHFYKLGKLIELIFKDGSLTGEQKMMIMDKINTINRLIVIRLNVLEKLL